ncbi:MAG: hypothetical protein CSB01_01910 [Bacteroidia bacterium]|nr:MAG: hypothetical protein CSB01_01910 [Bacteroidia bacterium]
MIKLLKIIIFFFAGSLFVSLYAQRPDLRFERLTDNNGRSLGRVTGIVQDSIGFLWIASSNGLFRYDGYSFTSFKNIRGDSTSIPYRNITSIYEDAKGIIWLMHDYFVPFSKEKRNFDYEIISKQKFEFGTKLKQDKWGNYWIGPSEKGLLCFDADAKHSQKFAQSPPMYSPDLYAYIDSLYRHKLFCFSLLDIGSKKDTSVEFHVKQTADFLIVSTAESSKARAYDYGSLTSGNKTLWSLEPEKAKHTGGQQYNKIQIGTIRLKKGSYRLNFTTDNSGAFNDWSPEKAPTKTNFYGIGLIEISQKEKKHIDKKIMRKYLPPNSILSNNFLDFTVGKNGNLCVASEKGLDIFSEKNNKFEHFEIDFKSILHLVNIRELAIQKVIQDSDGCFWFGTNRFGLIRYNLKSKEYKIYKAKEGSESLASNCVYSLLESSNGTIWVGTDMGISIINKNNNEIHSYQSNVKNRLFDNFIIDIFQDNAGNIWIASNQGLNRLIKPRFRFYDFKTENLSREVHIDKRANQDKFWFNDGTNNKLNCYDRKQNKFYSFPLKNHFFAYNTQEKQITYGIYDILEDSHGFLWLSIDNGLYLFSRKEKEVSDTLEIPNLPPECLDLEKINIINNEEVSDNILSIKEGKEDNLWLFTLYGIYDYDILHNKIKGVYRYGIKFTYVYEISSEFLKYVHEDKNNNFWIRNSYGIYFFDSEKKQLMQLYEFDDQIKYSSTTVNDNIYESKDGIVWFAMLPKLFYYDAQSKKFGKFSDESSGDFSDCKISSFNDTLLYILSDNGLTVFNREDSTFGRYTIEDGLADNTLNGIVDDKRGNLWITSSRGLSKFDKATKEFETVSEEFDSYKFIGASNENQDQTGELLFFTDKGFYSFYPDSINRHKPKIGITKFIVNSKEYALDSLVYLKRNIALNWDENFITLEFSAFDFSEPSNNQYAYMLEGLDKDWIYVDALNRKAVYTGISAKDYILRIKASNNDGVWNEKGIAIRIFIKPPFWQTTWFYSFFLLFVTLLIYLFIKYRERSLQREKRILEEKVQERTHEIERQKEEIKAQRDLATRQRDQISEQKQAIMDSIHYARRIQRAVLPPKDVVDALLPKHFVLYKPRDIVSGDYYWIKEIDNKIIVTAADCTGHGVPGAFMSMLGIAFLNEIVNKGKACHANEILNELKTHVIKSLHQTGKEGEAKDGMDIALCIVDKENMKLEFAGAYNPLYLVRKGELTQFKADRMPIGIHYSKAQSFTNHPIELQPNDAIYMFSDGYADQFGGKTGRKFMSKRFKKLLVDIQHNNMPEQKKILDQTIEQWKNGHEQIDDIVVFGIRI